ncbi:MAG: cell division protein ZapA [Clostridia bacterium]|nr:cell division protein ZapA [Clostridia bacterium]
MEKRKVTLRVMGKEYSLVTDQSEEQLTRIAGYVDRRMKELSIVTRANEGMIPLLTCMTLAEELINSQNENKRLVRELARLQEQQRAVNTEG